jgi:8-hydroxy-5-deazaflavin:NADPH oxidoreductase
MANKKVGILGSGQVGQVLANGFLKHGYQVMVGSRDPAKLQGWKDSTGGKGETGDFAATASFGEIVVLVTKGLAAAEALKLAGVENLAGKVVIDATNPIADAPPTNGVVKFFTTLDDSLMEQLQALAPKARLVKAFNSVGNAWMVNPSFPGGRPTMFICGNDDGAKREVSGILEQFGWDAADMGMATSARAIEPLCMLWCIPGFLRNEWTHAFKLLKL